MSDFWTGLQEGIQAGSRGLPVTKRTDGIHSFFGSSVSQTSTFNLLEAYNTSPIFRRVVSLIGDSLASTRWYLVKAKDPNRRGKSLPLWTRNAMLRSTRTKGLADGGEAITEHPFLSFLSLGSPMLSGPAGMKLSYCYMDTKGEFAWLLIPSGVDNTAPIAWLPIPPHWIDGEINTGAALAKINFRGTKFSVPGAALFYRSDPRLIDPFGRGSGMGDSLADELDTDEYAAEMLRTVFANKGFVDMLITVNTSDSRALIDAEARYNANHRGAGQAGRALFLGGDKVTAVPVAQPLSELRLLELREYQRQLVGQVYGVPPELLGEAGDRSRASAVQAEITFSRRVLVPRLEAMRLDMQSKLLPMFDPRGEYLLEYEDPTPDDIDARAALMQLKPDAYTLNEWRAISGHNSTNWGDNRSISMGAIEVDGPAPMLSPVAYDNSTNSSGSEKAFDAGLICETRDEPMRLLLGAPANTTTSAPAIITKSLTPGAIKKISYQVSPEKLAAKLLPEWTKQMQAVARRTLGDLGVAGSFDLVNPKIISNLESFAGDRCKLVTSTTIDYLRGALSLGVAEGEGIDKLTKRVQDVFSDLASFRAEAIARTEVMRSSNQANQLSWEGSGLKLRKRWISTRDGRVRASHLALDRTEIELSGHWTFNAALEPFKGTNVESPGDSGEASHDINCRCTHVAFDPEHNKSLSYDEGTVLWKAWSDSLTGWQTNAVSLIGEYSSETESDVIDALVSLA